MGTYPSCECLVDDKAAEQRVKCVPCHSDVADWRQTCTLDKAYDRPVTVPEAREAPTNLKAMGEEVYHDLGRDLASASVAAPGGPMEVPEVEVPPLQCAAGAAAGAAKGSFLTIMSLSGTWCNEGDNVTMGIVRAGVMTWDDVFHHGLTRITMTGPASVAMELFGEMHEAMFEPGPPARLHWDDGDIWRLITPTEQAAEESGTSSQAPKAS